MQNSGKIGFGLVGFIRARHDHPFLNRQDAKTPRRGAFGGLSSTPMRLDLSAGPPASSRLFFCAQPARRVVNGEALGTYMPDRGFFPQEDPMTAKKPDQAEQPLTSAPETNPKVQTDSQRLDEGLEETFPASDPVSTEDIE